MTFYRCESAKSKELHGAKIVVGTEEESAVGTPCKLYYNDEVVAQKTFPSSGVVIFEDIQTVGEYKVYMTDGSSTDEREVSITLDNIYYAQSIEVEMKFSESLPPKVAGYRFSKNGYNFVVTRFGDDWVNVLTLHSIMTTDWYTAQYSYNIGMDSAYKNTISTYWNITNCALPSKADMVSNVASLLGQLGSSAGNLWSWLSNSGSESYTAYGVDYYGNIRETNRQTQGGNLVCQMFTIKKK